MCEQSHSNIQMKFEDRRSNCLPTRNSSCYYQTMRRFKCQIQSYVQVWMRLSVSKCSFILIELMKTDCENHNLQVKTVHAAVFGVSPRVLAVLDARLCMVAGNLPAYFDSLAEGALSLVDCTCGSFALHHGTSKGPRGLQNMNRRLP